MSRFLRPEKISTRRRAPLLLVAAAALALILPASALAAYGAIAVNPRTAAYGTSFGYSTQHGAKERARHECDGRCKIAIWVRNQCGATVYNSHGFYSAGASSKRKAYKAASRKAPGHAKRLAYTCSG